MVRLMEVLLQEAGTKVLGWRTAETHDAIFSRFSVAPATHTLNQLRYDLRKMRAHELLQRAVQRYFYRLADKGTRVASLSVLFSPTRLRPARRQTLARTPNPSRISKIEAADHKSQPFHRAGHPTLGCLNAS